MRSHGVWFLLLLAVCIVGPYLLGGFDARDLVAYALGVAGAVLPEFVVGFHKPRRVG